MPPSSSRKGRGLGILARARVANQWLAKKGMKNPALIFVVRLCNTLHLLQIYALVTTILCIMLSGLLFFNDVDMHIACAKVYQPIQPLVWYGRGRSSQFVPSSGGLTATSHLNAAKSGRALHERHDRFERGGGFNQLNEGENAFPFPKEASLPRRVEKISLVVEKENKFDQMKADSGLAPLPASPGQMSHEAVDHLGSHAERDNNPHAIRNAFPVVIFSHHNPGLNRTVHEEWWSSSAGFQVYGYNISNDYIFALRDRSVMRRPRVPLPKVAVKKANDVFNSLEVAKQKQQNSDVRTVMMHFALVECPKFGNDAFFLIAEDDVRPCDGSLSHFHFLRSWLARYRAEWGMVRVGVGFTGVILKCSHLLPFLGHPWGPVESRAIDWAVSRFYELHHQQFGRELVYYRNIINHPRGGNSNIWGVKEVDARNKEHIPGCYDSIIWAGIPSSSFNPACINISKFSPCDTLVETASFLFS